jgi:carbonic anhydrase
VLAALHNVKLGLIDNWLRHIQDIVEKHREFLFQRTEEDKRHDALCELNVIEQVCNVAQTTVVQQAWERGQDLTIHGWIYALQDGLLRDLQVQVSDRTELTAAYRHALAELLRAR